MATNNNPHQTAGQLSIRSLVQQNVKHIFGIPGRAKMSKIKEKIRLRSSGAVCNMWIVA